MAVSEFDPKECPMGQLNELKIEHTEDKLTQMIERLEEKVSETQKSITSLSINMDQKFDSVDRRFDILESKIEEVRKGVPEQVQSELDKKKGQSASKVIGWVLTGVCGTAVISVVTELVKKALGL